MESKVSLKLSRAPYTKTKKTILAGAALSGNFHEETECLIFSCDDTQPYHCQVQQHSGQDHVCFKHNKHSFRPLEQRVKKDETMLSLRQMKWPFSPEAEEERIKEQQRRREAEQAQREAEKRRKEAEERAKLAREEAAKRQKEAEEAARARQEAERRQREAQERAEFDRKSKIAVCFLLHYYSMKPSCVLNTSFRYLTSSILKKLHSFFFFRGELISLVWFQRQTNVCQRNKEKMEKPLSQLERKWMIGLFGHFFWMWKKNSIFDLHQLFLCKSIVFLFNCTYTFRSDGMTCSTSTSITTAWETKWARDSHGRQVRISIFSPLLFALKNEVFFSSRGDFFQGTSNAIFTLRLFDCLSVLFSLTHPPSLSPPRANSTSSKLHQGF